MENYVKLIAQKPKQFSALFSPFLHPKVEPLKRWLARVGKERLDEIENPELAMQRMKEIYQKKGLSKGLDR